MVVPILHPDLLGQGLDVNFAVHDLHKGQCFKILSVSYFFQKAGFYVSCKLSPLEKICMKCQILFLGKIRRVSVCHLLNVKVHPVDL